MKPRRLPVTRLSLHFASALAALLTAPAVHAASDSWNVDAAGNWADLSSWLSGTQVPGSATTDNTDIATFANLLTAGRVVTVDANRYIGGISFGNTSAFGYTLGTGILHLNNGGVIQTLSGNGNHTDTISSAIVISGTSAASATVTAGATSATSLLSLGAVTGSATAGNTTTLTLNGSNTGLNAVTGVIGDGAGGGKLAVTKSDAGTWVLSGAGTYTGATTINSGTLIAGTSNGVTGIGASSAVLLGNTSGSVAATLQLGSSSTTTYANNITVQSGNTGTMTLNGHGNITLNGTVTLGTAGSTGKDLTLADPGNAAWVFTLGGAIQNPTGLSGSAGNVIIGSGNIGTVKLSAVNTYTGTTTVSGGTLNLTGSLTGGGAISTGGSAVITESAAGVISGASTFTQGSSGTSTLSGINTYTGVTTLTAGTLSVSSLANAGAASNLGAYATAGAGGLVFNGGSLTYTGGTVTTNRGFTTSYTSTAASGAGINVNGAAGSVLTMGDWTTTVGNAFLGVAGTSGNSLVLGNGSVTNGQIGFGASIPVSTGTITFNSVGGFTDVVNSNGTAPVTVAGIVLGSSGNGVGGASASNVINVVTGVISGGMAAGNVSLWKPGTNTWELDGNNTFTGNTQIQNGGLIIKSDASLGATTGATILIGNNSPFLKYIGTGDTSARVISLAGGTGFTMDQSGSGLWKFTANFATPAAATHMLTLQGSTAGSGEISGVIPDGASSNKTSVTKTGTGTWTLSGANSYTGTTAVNGGTLALNYATNASVLSSSTAVTLGGGTLQLTGKSSGATAQTVASLSLTAGSNAINLLSNGGTGTTLTITSATLSTAAGSSVNFNYYDGGAGTTNGAFVGNDIVAWNPTLTGGIIGAGYTVTDSGGSGYATVLGGKVVRYTDPGSAGLPLATGSSSGSYFVNSSYSTSDTGTAGSLVEALAGPVAANIITVDTTGLASGANLALGANTLTLTAGGGMVFTGANPYTISGSAGITSSASGTITLNNYVTSSSGVTLSVPITNTTATAVTFAGTGNTILGAAETYSGNTTINSGTVTLSGGSTVLYSGVTGGTATITVASGATLNIAGAINALSNGLSGATGNVASWTVNGTITNTGTQTTSTPPTINLNNGTLTGTTTIGTYGSFYFGQTTTLTASGSGNVISAQAMALNGALTLSTPNTTDTLSISSIIGVTGNLAGSLTKSGSGTVTLTGANIYNGSTTVSAGTLKLGNATALGNTAGNTTISAGATVDLNGQTIAEPFGTITGGGVNNNGALINSSGTAASITGTITTGGANSSVGGSGNITLATVTGGGTLTKVGANALTLGGSADNVSVGVAVNGGTVVLGKASTTGVHSIGGASSVGSGGTIQLGGTGDYQWYGGIALTVNSGGVLDLNGKNQNNNAVAGGALNLNGTGISSGGALINSASATTSTLTLGTANIVLQSDGSIGGAGNITVASGAITGGFALTKIGAGTVSLAGANTYSGGTTISGGTLQVSGSGSLGGGSYAGGIAFSNSSTLRYSSSTAQTLSGAINGAGALVKDTSGSVLTLGNSNSYSGGTTISSGVLLLNHLNAIANSSSVSVASGTMLELTQTGTYATAGTISLVGSGTGGNNPGALYFGSGGVTTTVLNAPLTLAGATTVSSYGVTMNQTLGGAIGGTGPLTIASQGGGSTHTAVWTLNAANTYSGNTVINNNLSIADITVKLGVANALPTTTSLNLQGTGNFANSFVTLDLNGNNQTLAGLTDSGSGSSNNFGKRVINSGALATLTINNAGADTYGTTGTGVNAGTIGGTTAGGAPANNLALTKTGVGTLTLQGANTYTGATAVSQGTLALVGGSQKSPITVSAGASLGFTLGSPTTSTSTFNLSAGTIQITGTPTLASYTLITSSAGITGTPVLAAPIPGYVLQVSGNALNLVQAAGFSSWITGTFANGTVPAGQQGPNDNPTHDGISNLLKYAIAGQDPTVANPTISTFNGTTLSFAKRTDATGLTYAIQQSTDLGVSATWAEVPAGANYVNNSTTISYTFPAGSPVKNFIRLKVLETP